MTLALAQPIGDVGLNSGLPICRVCGTGAHATASGRCARGHLILGHTASVKTGEHSVAFWAAAEGRRVELRDGLLEAYGFTYATAPADLRVAADGVAQAAVLRDGTWLRLLQVGGPMSSADKARRVFDVWGTSGDQADRGLRLLKVLAAGRRAKSADLARSFVEAQR